MGFEILLKGNNMIRLLQGVWVALRISLISVVLSMAFGILLGMIMTSKNRINHCICILGNRRDGRFSQRLSAQRSEDSV